MSRSHLNTLCSDSPASLNLEIEDTNSDQKHAAESLFPSDKSSEYLEDTIAGKESMVSSLSKDQKGNQFPTCSSSKLQPLQGNPGHWRRITYPFEWIKPGGFEGEITLKDINKQIHMTLSKPIPHPRGDSVTSAQGFGISGKAVTSLTRIHTKGRGSITVIRTKD